MAFERISVDHEVMGGAPCIAGTRIPVATVVSLVAEDESIEQILVAYPHLVADDIRDALRFAAEAVSGRELPTRTSAFGTDVGAVDLKPRPA